MIIINVILMFRKCKFLKSIKLNLNCFPNCRLTLSC